MLDQVIQIVSGSNSSILFTVLFILGIILVGGTFLSKFKAQGINVSTKRIQSRITERWISKSGTFFIAVGFIGLLINNANFSNDSPKKININSWVGTWSVYLEEFGGIGYASTNEFEIDFSIETRSLEGVLYNEKRRPQAYLTKIEADEGGYSYIKGKIGNNDGRKQEFQFMMFPDKKAFIGKYRERNTDEEWVLWVSHKID